MPSKPRQVKCQVPGCDSGWTNLEGVEQEGPYFSDPECGTVAERQADLKDHVAMYHDHEKGMIEARAKEISAQAAKLSAEADKLLFIPHMCPNGAL